MAYSVEKLVIPDWKNVDVGGKYVHAFIFPISSQDLLPPGDYCDVIKRCAPAIVRNHSTASIWVQVNSPGLWYPLEVRRALSHVKNIAVAVTRSGSDLRISDFSNCMPYLSNSRISSPPFAKNWVSPVQENSLACLPRFGQVGARSDERDRIPGRLLYSNNSRCFELSGRKEVSLSCVSISGRRCEEVAFQKVSILDSKTKRIASGSSELGGFAGSSFFLPLRGTAWGGDLA